MHLTGLVLDAYDDFQAIREIWPRHEDVPPSIKTAYILGHHELSKLPDGVFALVLHGQGAALRKYACVDAGNTELHIAYLLKHAHKLPDEARHVAANNLIRACGWYDITPPEALEKLAIGPLQLLVAPSVIKGTSEKIRNNLSGVRALEGPHGQVGGSVVPPADLKALFKTSALNSEPRKIPNVAPEKWDLSPHVDVSNLEAPTAPIEKKAKRHALWDYFYPLDSYREVKEAAAYFDECGYQHPPSEKHAFAVNVCERARELGIELGDNIRKYGSTEYAPLPELKAAMEMRYPLVPEPFRMMYESLFERHAELHPDVYCDALGALDKIAKITWRYDSALLDPFASTYGFERSSDRTIVGER